MTAVGRAYRPACFILPCHALPSVLPLDGGMHGFRNIPVPLNEFKLYTVEAACIMNPQSSHNTKGIRNVEVADSACVIMSMQQYSQSIVLQLSSAARASLSAL